MLPKIALGVVTFSLGLLIGTPSSLAGQSSYDCGSCEGDPEEGYDCLLGCDVMAPLDCGECGDNDEGYCVYVSGGGCSSALIIDLSGAVYANNDVQGPESVASAAPFGDPNLFRLVTLPDRGEVKVRSCDGMIVTRLYSSDFIARARATTSTLTL